MPRFRFQLRTLLLFTLVIGCGLGWWFRPYTLEEHWPNGELRCRLQVRRQANGEVVTNGKQSWWWRNGQLAREGESFGHRVFLQQRSFAILTIPLENEKLYTREGGPINTRGAYFESWLRSEAFERRQGELPRMHPADRFPETPHDVPEIYVR